MFTTLFVQPIFNLLVLIYALLPAHNFGLALILFTVLIRLLMWPLVKKQLNHSKALRELQPELKRIKKAAKGDRQKESAMVMELYKEREINIFAPFGILLVQLPILIALYNGINKLIKDPNEIVNFSYGFVRDLPWLQDLAQGISKFDNTLFGVVDLTRSALPGSGGIYWPAMIIVIASAVIQYYQSKQLMPADDKARSLRQILKDAGSGQQAEREEVTAATNRLMRFFVPVLIFFFTVNIASALSLYWLVSGLVAFLQQSYILRQDTEDLEKVADKAVSASKSERAAKREKAAVPAEIVAEPEAKSSTATSSKQKPSHPAKKKAKGKRKKG